MSCEDMSWGYEVFDNKHGKQILIIHARLRICDFADYNTNLRLQPGQNMLDMSLMEIFEPFPNNASLILSVC